MRKNKIFVMEMALYFVFAALTIIVLYFVYRNPDSKYAMGFIIGYCIFTILFGLYILVSFIINIKRLKWWSLKKNLTEFLILFLILAASNYLFDYYFRPYKIDLLREFSVAFGLSFLISFSDYFSLKKEM